jgi:hypothetical protein
LNIWFSEATTQYHALNAIAKRSRDACLHAALKAVVIIRHLLLHPGAQAVQAAIAQHVIDSQLPSAKSDSLRFQDCNGYMNHSKGSILKENIE